MHNATATIVNTYRDGTTERYTLPAFKAKQVARQESFDDDTLSSIAMFSDGSEACYINGRAYALKTMKSTI